jgi:hypothetical protein
LQAQHNIQLSTLSPESHPAIPPAQVRVEHPQQLQDRQVKQPPKPQVKHTEKEFQIKQTPEVNKVDASPECQLRRLQEWQVAQPEESWVEQQSLLVTNLPAMSQKGKRRVEQTPEFKEPAVSHPQDSSDNIPHESLGSPEEEAKPVVPALESMGLPKLEPQALQENLRPQATVTSTEKEHVGQLEVITVVKLDTRFPTSRAKNQLGRVGSRTTSYSSCAEASPELSIFCATTRRLVEEAAAADQGDVFEPETESIACESDGSAPFAATKRQKVPQMEPSCERLVAAPASL